ncbi:MAG: TonB family protein [Planctomycetota bacterium]
MKLRVLASSLALHTGVLVGAAAWAFGAAGGAPRTPAVVRFEPVAHPAAQAQEDRTPSPEFEDLEPIQPDEQVEEPSPRPFEPPAAQLPQAERTATPDAILPDLFAQVRVPEAPAQPPETPTEHPEPQPRTAEPAVPPSPAPAPARVEAKAVDSRNSPPAYPQRAIRDSHEGTVGLLVSIDATGRVLDVTITAPCRHPELNRAARDAVQDWRYEPARLDDEPVASEKVVEIVFELRSQSVTRTDDRR